MEFSGVQSQLTSLVCFLAARFVFSIAASKILSYFLSFNYSDAFQRFD